MPARSTFRTTFAQAFAHTHESMKHFTSCLALLSFAALAVLAPGCQEAKPPDFRLNMVRMVDPQVEASEAYQKEIANVLGGLFGTPDHPVALPETGLDQAKLNMAAGPAWSDQQGVNHGLYRKHCVHCHGISGDGRGPTARFLNPYPRDYRMGKFKFKSNAASDRPTDDDLHRILWHGAPGTSMPSFSLLASAELEALVEYVKYLAIRGEVERALAAYVYDELGMDEVEDDQGNTQLVRIPLNPVGDDEDAQVQREDIAAIVSDVADIWAAANDSVVVPDESEIPDLDQRSAEERSASIVKGRELFYDKRANCYTCHGPTGLGDGQTTDYDDWAKEQLEIIAAAESQAESIEDERQEIAALKEEMAEIEDEEQLLEAQDELDEAQRELERSENLLAERREVIATFYPIRNAIPRNLRAGVYRGGRRRIDIFWRIHEGIPGSPMPGVGATLSDEEIWNLVDYVLSLPYEAGSIPQRALPTNLESVTN